MAPSVEPTVTFSYIVQSYIRIHAMGEPVPSTDMYRQGVVQFTNHTYVGSYSAAFSALEPFGSCAAVSSLVVPLVDVINTGPLAIKCGHSRLRVQGSHFHTLRGNRCACVTLGV